MRDLAANAVRAHDRDCSECGCRRDGTCCPAGTQLRVVAMRAAAAWRHERKLDAEPNPAQPVLFS